MVAIILVCRLIFFTPSEELPFRDQLRMFQIYFFGHSIFEFLKNHFHIIAILAQVHDENFFPTGLPKELSSSKVESLER